MQLKLAILRLWFLTIVQGSFRKAASAHLLGFYALASTVAWGEAVKPHGIAVASLASLGGLAASGVSLLRHLSLAAVLCFVLPWWMAICAAAVIGSIRAAAMREMLMLDHRA